VPFGIGIFRLDSQGKAKQTVSALSSSSGELLQAQQGMHASQQLVLVDGLLRKSSAPHIDPVDPVGVTVSNW